MRGRLRLFKSQNVYAGTVHPLYFVCFASTVVAIQCPRIYILITQSQNVYAGTVRVARRHGDASPAFTVVTVQRPRMYILALE